MRKKSQTLLKTYRENQVPEHTLVEKATSSFYFF